mgnify:CR=1 FL=1
MSAAPEFSGRDVWLEGHDMVSTSPAPKVTPQEDPPAVPAAAGVSGGRGASILQEHALKLSMVSIEKGGVILVAAEGNITSSDVDPTSTNPLQTLLGATWCTNRVLLNMELSGYIDSSAIGWLMSTQKQFKDAGGKFVIYNVQPAVRQLLDMLKIGRILPIADDEAGARKLLAEGGAK